MLDQKTKNMTNRQMKTSNNTITNKSAFWVEVVLQDGAVHTHYYPTYLSMQKAKSAFIRMANRMKASNILPKNKKQWENAARRINTDLTYDVWDFKTNKTKTITKSFPQIKSVKTSVN